VAARTDCKADVTFRISGGFFTQSYPHANGRTDVRFHTGGYAGGKSTLEIMNDAVAHFHDFRGDSGGADVTLGTGGETYFRVIGSDATISWSHNFNTDQDGKLNTVNVMEFVADAGGVSTIRAGDSAATFRPSNGTTLRVDLTDYAGIDELTLFAYDNYGGSGFGVVEIIDPLSRGYAFAEGGGRSYLYLPGGPPAPSATSFFTK
jgi:hypothetical protein